MKKIIYLSLVCLIVGNKVFAQITNLTQLERKAQNGNVEAQLEIANAYFLGNGVEHDMEKAEYWWVKAADKGDSQAMHNLFVLYSDEEQSKFYDCGKAITYARKAAEKGDQSCANYLNNVKEIGHSDWGDCQPFYPLDLYYAYLSNKLSDILQEEAHNGNPIAALMLGIHYCINGQDSKGFNTYLNASKILDKYEGDAISSFLEEKGKSLKVRLSSFSNEIDLEAFDNVDRVWYHLWTYLGYMYEMGYGTTQDYTKAIACYKKSLSNEMILWSSLVFGYVGDADFHLKLCKLRMGQCNEIKEWIEDSEDYKRGHPVFDIWIGEAYLKGIGCISQNANKGFYYLMRATDDRDGWFVNPNLYGDACYRIYECYRDGIGTKKDSKMAETYFRTALKFGSNSALYDDQIHYERGL